MNLQWWCVATAEPWSWQWQAYPGVWLFIGALAAGYWRLARGSEGARPGYFFVGLALLWIALDWPVGALGAGYLASVHMVQFLLIALIAPPFLLLGIPDRAFHRLVERAPRGVGLLSHPVTALIVFTVLLAVTHWPLVVDALMSSQAGNFLLDATWLFTGIVFWWPVVAPAPEREWLTAPVRMGYLIAATLLNTGVFIYLTFSELPLYATFELAPPVGSLSSRDDQVLAGLLMKMGGAVVLWTAITILFFRWFAGEEQRHMETAEA